jgi:hypothetical protein
MSGHGPCLSRAGPFSPWRGVGGWVHRTEPYDPAVASYRISLTVGDLAPGVEPHAVLPAAAAAARERVTVEAQDLAVVHGRARITVRCVCDTDADAVDVARRVRAVTAGLAHVSGLTLSRRYGARWHPVAPYF